MPGQFQFCSRACSAALRARPFPSHASASARVPTNKTLCHSADFAACFVQIPQMSPLPPYKRQARPDSISCSRCWPISTSKVSKPNHGMSTSRQHPDIAPNTPESASAQETCEDHVAMSVKLVFSSHRPASCRWARTRRLECRDLEPCGSFQAQGELVLVAADERVPKIKLKGCW